jgi:hypothetical protein
MLALGGCSRGSDTSRSEVVQLPGFSVELPVGQVEKSTKLTSAGSHHLKLMPLWAASLPQAVRDVAQLNKGTLSVHWRAGAMTPADLKEVRDALVKSTAAAIGWHVEHINDEQGRWVALISDGRHRMSIAGAYCAPGLSIYVNLAMPDAAAIESEARRVIQSLVCRLGSKIPELPVLGVTLTSDYGYVPDSLQDMYVSVHGPFLTVSPSDGNILAGKGAVPLLNHLFGTLMGAPGAKLDLRREDIKRPDAQPAALFEAQGANGLPEGNALIIGALYCQDLDLSYFLAMMGEGVTTNDVRQLVLHADCSGYSGERPPPAGDVLGKACDAGEGQACGNLSELIALGKITDSTRSIPTLRTRACQLNARAWCAAGGGTRTEP